MPREASPGGGSTFVAPPYFPFKVDLFFEEHERLELIRVEDASTRLHPDALKLTLPFDPNPPMPAGWETVSGFRLRTKAG